MSYAFVYLVEWIGQQNLELARGCRRPQAWQAPDAKWREEIERNDREQGWSNTRLNKEEWSSAEECNII